MGDVPQATAKTDFSNMLAQEHLEALRKEFVDDALVQPSRAALVNLFPTASTPYEKIYIDAALKMLYGDQSQALLTPLDREVIVTTVLAVQGRGQGPYLGIHIYWTLMVGWSPKQLAEQLLVISIYNGISTLSAAYSNLGALLTGLDAWTRANLAQPENLKAGVIIGQILNGFSGNTPRSSGSGS